MKEKILKNKTLVIVVAAIVVCAVGFAAGMMVKTALAHDSGNYIGAEKAKVIALESVGVSPASPSSQVRPRAASQPFLPASLLHPSTLV